MTLHPELGTGTCFGQLSMNYVGKVSQDLMRLRWEGRTREALQGLRRRLDFILGSRKLVNYIYSGANRVKFFVFVFQVIIQEAFGGFNEPLVGK